MKLKKCQGYLASQIRWGIELETRIPTTASPRSTKDIDLAIGLDLIARAAIAGDL
jgi:hypothetical protein